MYIISPVFRIQFEFFLFSAFAETLDIAFSQNDLS